MCNSFYDKVVMKMYSALGKAENHVRCGDFKKAADICAGIVATLVMHDLRMPPGEADNLRDDIRYIFRYYEAYYGKGKAVDTQCDNV